MMTRMRREARAGVWKRTRMRMRIWARKMARIWARKRARMGKGAMGKTRTRGKVSN